jgi:hypothetical protein
VRTQLATPCICWQVSALDEQTLVSDTKERTFLSKLKAKETEKLEKIVPYTITKEEAKLRANAYDNMVSAVQSPSLRSLCCCAIRTREFSRRFVQRKVLSHSSKPVAVTPGGTTRPIASPTRDADSPTSPVNGDSPIEAGAGRRSLRLSLKNASSSSMPDDTLDSSLQAVRTVRSAPAGLARIDRRAPALVFGFGA